MERECKLLIENLLRVKQKESKGKKTKKKTTKTSCGIIGNGKYKETTPCTNKL